MPKNTRVYRCVKAVHKGTNKNGKPRYSYGDAIAICQASTKQNYRTGASISRGTRIRRGTLISKSNRKGTRKSNRKRKRNRKSKTQKQRQYN